MPAKGQKRKQQIIEAAKKMFLDKGYQSTHIGEVCKDLDIARGTVYQYFGNKREILFAILEEVEDKVDDIFDKDDLLDYIAEAPSSQDMRNYLIDRLKSCVETLISEPIVIKLVFKEIPGIDDEVIKRLSKFVDYITKVITRDIEELKKQDFYKDNNNSRVTSITLIGGVLLLVHEFDKKGDDVLQSEIISSVVDTLLNGLLV